MNIINEGKIVYKKFRNAFNTDTESVDDIGFQLINKYKSATEKEKEFMDDIFISLCGWSFETLCKKTNIELEE